MEEARGLRRNHRFTVEEPSQQMKAHFSSIPWAAKLFQDPTLLPFVIDSRRSNVINPTTGDTMCGKTLATEDTITAWQSFYRDATKPGERPEVWGLLKLGSGVNGHIDTCHGGFLSVVLDEILGNVAEHEKPVDRSTMTAYLHVGYKKPVHTPGCVLVKAGLEKKEGRKIWVNGTIEDGQGNVSTTGEALFIVIDPAILKARI